MNYNNSFTPDASDDIWIVYDGDCPFCSAYVKLVRLREVFKKIHLINVRDGGPIIEEIMAIPLDLDEGMVLKANGKFYHGDECMHILSMMTTKHGIFNQVIAWTFKSRRRTAILYPLLRAGRNLVLRILGRTKITPEK